MTIPRNDINAVYELVINGLEGVEVDLGNSVTALATDVSGSSPGCRLFDVVWWIDGVRYRETINERELATTATRYLQNTTDCDPPT